MFASAVAVALVVGGIVALTFIGGDDDGDASAATTNPDTSDGLDDEPETTDVENITTTVTTTEPDIRRTGLQPNEWLESGQSIATEDGDLQLRLHPEGWLELIHHGKVIWEAGRGSPTPGAAAVMGDDGNFVLYRSRREAESYPSEAALFSTGTGGYPGAVLELVHSVGDDAYVAVVFEGVERWSEPDSEEDSEAGPVLTTEPSPSSSLDTSSSTSVVTTSPQPADIELIRQSAGADDAEIDLTFVNWGGSEGYVERIEFVVAEVVGRVSRSPEPSSATNFDLSANLNKGVRCRFDPGWNPIPATGNPVVRTVRFGLAPDGQSIGRFLQLEMTVAGENVRERAIDVSVDVVGTSSASPAIRPACTQG